MENLHSKKQKKKNDKEEKKKEVTVVNGQEGGGAGAGAGGEKQGVRGLHHTQEMTPMEPTTRMIKPPRASPELLRRRGIFSMGLESKFVWKEEIFFFLSFFLCFHHLPKGSPGDFPIVGSGTQ